MIIGTAGHIDHGKTALVRALTGVDTDRLKEEKARGISIDLGFAYLSAPDGTVLGFVDVPGHEHFVRNMLAGATGIDFALLVVAADDGVMEQTIEHLAIVDLLGVGRGIVALSKTDLVSPPRRDEVVAEITGLLGGTRLASAGIIPVSNVTSEGIPELREHLFHAAQTWSTRASGGRFRMAVDRCFTLAGAGTVVTGIVLSGAVAVGDRIVVSPAGLAARVRSIHAQNQPADRGRAGERCALNLAGEGIAKETVRRGDVVLDPGLHLPSDRIDVELRLLASETKPAGQWMPVRLHHGASDVGARIVLLSEKSILPGEETVAQLVLEKPIAAAVGDRFVVRDSTAQRTIGGGRILDLRAPARRRRTADRRAQLDALAMIEPERSLAALLDCSPRHVDLAAFARDRALGGADLEAMAEQLGMVRIAVPAGVVALSAAAWAEFRHRLVATLAAFHADNPDLPGIGRERLRLALEPRLPAPAFLSALQGLVRGREVVLDGAWVRLPGHEVRLTRQDEEVWYEIQPLLSGPDRYRPPRVRDIAGILTVAEPEVRRILKLLGRMGILHEVAHDHFFLRATLLEIVEIITELALEAPDGQFTAGQLRDRLDNGRKVAIQVLEFLDRHGVTLRRGDLRRVNQHRLDLFGRPPDLDSSHGNIPQGGETSLVGRPDFKSGRGREPVLGGFDSHSLPPHPEAARR